MIPTSNYGAVTAVYRNVTFIGSQTAVSSSPVQIDGDARIVALTNDRPHFGRLEVFHNGMWGSVCSDGFSSLAARVACRQIGFAGGDVSTTECSALIKSDGSNLCGATSQRVLLDDVTCLGGEDGLRQCPRIPWTSIDKCSHARDVVVECFLTSSPELIELAEGFDIGTEVGTGAVVTPAIVSTFVNDTWAKKDALPHTRAVPIPAMGKPVHEEYHVECSPIRLQQAQAVVCFPAKAFPTLYDRCIADYCLTGSAALAAVNVDAMKKDAQQQAVVADAKDLLHQETVRQEGEQAVVQQDVNHAVAKQAEQDAVVGQIIRSRMTTADQPCPP